VSIDVENTGRSSGSEVVQLYIHQRAGSASRPVRELKGFQRTLLAPSEKKTVHFTVGKDELSFWSPEAKAWVEESEEFDVWVGGDSTASLHARFRVGANESDSQVVIPKGQDTCLRTELPPCVCNEPPSGWSSRQATLAIRLYVCTSGGKRPRI